MLHNGSYLSTLKKQTIGSYRRQTLETALQCVHALARVATRQTVNGYTIFKCRLLREVL